MTSEQYPWAITTEPLSFRLGRTVCLRFHGKNRRTEQRDTQYGPKRLIAPDYCFNWLSFKEIYMWLDYRDSITIPSYIYTLPVRDLRIVLIERVSVYLYPSPSR